MLNSFRTYFLKLQAIACILVCSCSTLSGQDEQPFFKHLMVEDGLSNNWVKAVLKDKDGFMWFGTFNGLNRYDGNNFKVFQASETSNLGDNIIESLEEDSEGNLWVGTFSGGLHRFDRKTETFTRFQHDPNKEESISDNRIYVVYMDQKSQLWIGTNAGLDRYDATNNTFVHYKHNPTDPKSLTPGLVSSIYQDHQGRLWIGTEGGLNMYSSADNSFTRYRHDASDPFSLAQNYVKSIYEDKYGNIWLGTWGGGLDKFQADTKRFQHFQYTPGKTSGLSNNSVLAVAGDNENLIYVATEGGGLNVFDLQKEKFRSLIPDITNARSINSNSVHTLYYDDENGLLWAGTYNGGINYFSKWDKPFIRYQARVFGLNNNHVTGVTEDQQGRLWIGTDGGGVNVLNPRTNTYTYIEKREGAKNGLQSNAILSLLCDKQNTIWVGSYEGGLDLVKNNGKEIIHFTHDPSDPTSLSEKNVSAIYEDKRGQMWVGTMFGGLNLYHKESQTFTSYKHNAADTTSIIDNFIYGIFEDRLGHLLVQTGKGIEQFDYKLGRFARYNPALTEAFGVPGTLLEDSQGNLWVGSQENGLFRVDRTGVKVNRYTTRDGLPSNSICGILEDDFGNLWISTQRGLCKFEEAVINPEKIKFHIYSVEDGLQGSEFKRGAFCKTKDGLMVFGGQNGFNVFDPLKIKFNPFVPPLKITGFKIFNKEIDFTKADVLNVPISETEAIRLRHHQSVFTFEFSALNYMLAEKNQYAYMMEGFEETWNYVGTQRSATYSNLDAGEYYFNVKAANNDGIWNDTGIKIRITIVPPWWDNAYFKTGLIALLMIGVFAFFRIRTFQLKRSKRELEERVALSTTDLKTANTTIEERQKEILHQNEILLQKNRELEIQSREMKSMAGEIQELTEAKSKFIANISQELQPSLNTILTESKELYHQTEVPDQLADKHSIIYGNAKRLWNLIHQLLDRKEDASTVSRVDQFDAPIDPMSNAEEVEELKDHTSHQAPFLLIIEADADGLRSKDIQLTSAYHIESATNGTEGMRMATELVPDLIICDLHLPDMDGVVLCNKLKSDERTSHIPIIVMTMRTSDDQPPQTIPSEADDFITKPFQLNLLDLKIKNIFFTRQKLKEMFLHGALTMPEQFNMSQVDKEFLKDAIAAVKKHMQDSSFGVDEFSSHFGMSRRNVLRKMKGVTGLSINEYIRNTRLKEAYSMLLKGERNVSEVAYSVGFTDPKYFSNCFKKLFGKLPSDVRSITHTS